MALQDKLDELAVYTLALERTLLRVPPELRHSQSTLALRRNAATSTDWAHVGPELQLRQTLPPRRTVAASADWAHSARADGLAGTPVADHDWSAADWECIHLVEQVLTEADDVHSDEELLSSSDEAEYDPDLLPLLDVAEHVDAALRALSLRLGGPRASRALQSYLVHVVRCRMDF